MSSDLELQSPTEDTPVTSLSIATIRIILGTGFGVSIVALLFCIWTIYEDEGGPAIGVLVFQLFTTASIVFIMYHAIIKKVNFT